MHAPTGTSLPTKSPTARTAAFAAAFVISLSGLGWQGTAHAASPQDKLPTVKVKYADLDLSTEVGLAALYERIQVAARQVCPGAHSLILTDVVQSESCQAETIAKVVSTFNNPRLAMLHAARSPKS